LRDLVCTHLALRGRFTCGDRGVWTIAAVDLRFAL